MRQMSYGPLSSVRFGELRYVADRQLGCGAGGDPWIGKVQ
jgi:DUF917 family protein